MYDFAVERPTNLDDASRLLAKDETQVIAGGQTLIPTMKSRLASPKTLVSLTGIDEIKGVSPSQGSVTIGAATRHVDVANETRTLYPALASLAANIGDPAVRNRGTIGGSLANNDPSACYPAAALAGDAEIKTQECSYSADDFFCGLFETALSEGEFITEIRFPIPDRASYQKFEQPASRFALVGVFVTQKSGQVRVAVTGASEEGVYRWKEAEQALSDDFRREAIADLIVPAEGKIVDIHGSAAYRAHLVKVLTGRAVDSAH